MKKVLLSVIILWGIVPYVFSQIEKGTVMVGGNAGFQFKANNRNEREFTFSLSPYALYSVIKPLALGGQLSYSFNQYKNTDVLNPVTIAHNTFSIGPALRGNIHIGGKTYFFLHGSPSFGIDVQRDPTDRNQSYYSTSVITWRLGPGFSIFATKKMAVELGMFYDGMKSVLAIKQNKNVLLKGEPVFTHGLTVAVGLQFYCHKKSKNAESQP